MALMERVATLMRANLNDLLDQAEDPETLLKQVMLDLQNQLMQVKTQVAIAIADQHVLARKQKEHQETADGWVRKAELAVAKQEDDLARAAIERSLASRGTAEHYLQQLRHHTVQVENLRSALRSLQEKLSEAQTRNELLAAQHRRARALERTGEAHLAMADGLGSAAFDRMKGRMYANQAEGEAKTALASESMDDRLHLLEKQDRVERLLAEMKARQP